MIDYEKVYVDEVEEFYREICRSKAFQTIKFNDEKNYQPLLKFAVKKGEKDLCALLIVAEILMLKKDLNKNDEKRIYQIAVKLAKVKYTRGTNLLAMCYYRGVGTKKNFDKAVEIYKKNAFENDLLALHNLESLGKKGFIDYKQDYSVSSYDRLGTVRAYHRRKSLLKKNYKKVNR